MGGSNRITETELFVICANYFKMENYEIIEQIGEG